VGKYLTDSEIRIWVGRRRETEAGDALEHFLSFASPDFTKELRGKKFSNFIFTKRGAQASAEIRRIC
jgi:hypothetical protein